MNVMTHGEPTDRPALLIAHGLFGSARNWGVIARRLAETRQVHVVDMRNHGESFWDDSHSYQVLAGDLAQVISGACDVLGHSMGGKAAMALALLHPEKVRRLVVADIAPVGYLHTQMHLVQAMSGLDLSEINSRGDADKALTAAVADAGVRAFLLQSLDVKEKKWRLNLRVLEARMADIIGWPDISGQFDGPVLFLSGAESDYVLPAHHPDIKRHFPQARFAELAGAGHWLHADKPREFEAAVQTFLDRAAG